MPERTEYAPGTPCWLDLAAPDVGAAASFGEKRDTPAGAFAVAKDPNGASFAVIQPSERAQESD